MTPPAMIEAQPPSLFRSLFHAYPDALLLVDRGGKIALANPAAAALFGYQAEELEGMAVDELVPDAVRQRHAAYRQAYALAPKPRPMGTQMELTARRRDGSEVMVEIALSPLQDQASPYVVAAVRGIGAYPRVRQALQRARYAEHVAQLGRQALDTRDPQALLQHVPVVAADALQCGTAMVYLLEPNQLEFRLVSGVGLLARHAEPQRVANRPDTPLGYVYASSAPVVISNYARESRFKVSPAVIESGAQSGIAAPLFDHSRVVGVLLARADTAQRFGDDELQFMSALANLLATSLQRALTEEQLSHAQRMESVGQLTGGIAHDFNNLLTVIHGNLQMLGEHAQARGDAHADRLVGAAARAAKRGAELTGKLLAFSRRQLLVPARVELDPLLHSLADMLRRTLDERIRISVDVALGCPPVQADAGQLEAALLNLGLNARDAMPEGGALSFSAQPCHVLPPELRTELDASARVDDAFVAIGVRDTGVGMTEEVRDRAFEPFFTTKEKGRGTGLGLSTVYGFVRQSKGVLALESAVGAGTTLTLYLPRHVEAPGGEARHEEGSAPTVREGLRVMLVEDDPEVRSIVLAYLHSFGHVVDSYADAESALAALAPHTAIDLLLTDVVLGPGMRGTELARQALQRRPELAVLLMSGYSQELQGGPTGWELLRKPFAKDELASAIGRAMK
jgi:PAS domain S-box-containing protein